MQRRKLAIERSLYNCRIQNIHTPHFVHTYVYNIESYFVYRLICSHGDIRKYDAYRYVLLSDVYLTLDFKVLSV